MQIVSDDHKSLLYTDGTLVVVLRQIQLKIPLLVLDILYKTEKLAPHGVKTSFGSDEYSCFFSCSYSVYHHTFGSLWNMCQPFLLWVSELRMPSARHINASSFIVLPHLLCMRRPWRAAKHVLSPRNKAQHVFKARRSTKSVLLKTNESFNIFLRFGRCC